MSTTKIILFALVISASFLKATEVTHTDFKYIDNPYISSVIGYSFIEQDKKSIIHIDIKLIDKTIATKAWLSLSFPELKSDNSIKNIKQFGFDTIRTYPQKTPIWNHLHKKNTLSKHLLIEGSSQEWDRWEKSSSKLLSFDIDITQMRIEEFITLHFRIELHIDEAKFTFPKFKNAHTMTGQQGYLVIPIKLERYTSYKEDY